MSVCISTSAVFYSQLSGSFIQNCAYCKVVRMYCFLLLTTETVVAVPISITINGTGYSFNPATRSAPSCPGLSIMMFRPVFIPGPRTMTSFLRIFSAASLAMLAICGTTDFYNICLSFIVENSNFFFHYFSPTILHSPTSNSG